MDVHGPDPLVIGVRTALSTSRHGPRQTVRAVLAAVLAARLGCVESSIGVTSTPGLPPRLEGTHEAGLWLSISHAPGLSLLAIDPRGPVGVDLMQVNLELAGMDDWAMLAQDYLEPDVAAGLARCVGMDLPRRFAEAWTAHEARLKCLGLPLQEMSAALQHELALSQVLPLNLPTGYVGCLSRA